jgi:glycosyltransferase involved in cell wall biosynthesis
VLSRMQQLDPDLITVGIPAYNAQSTLGETLWSVRRQTYKKFHAIVVDDGSSDRTSEIAQWHADADPRITVLRKPNGGVASARNMALACARGKYFANLDADDLWHHEMLSRQVATLRAGMEEVVLCYTWFAYIDENSRILSTAEPSFEGNVISRMCRGNLIGNGSSAMMLTDVLRDVGGWDPNLKGRNDDYSTFFALAERGDFAVIRSHLLGYRQTIGNTTSDAGRMLASYDTVVQRYMPRHIKHRAQFAAGRAELIGYLFDKAVLNRRWRSAARLVGEAWATDRRRAWVMVSQTPLIFGRIILPLGVRSVLRASSARGVRKGALYLQPTSAFRCGPGCESEAAA